MRRNYYGSARASSFKFSLYSGPGAPPTARRRCVASPHRIRRSQIRSIHRSQRHCRSNSAHWIRISVGQPRGDIADSIKQCSGNRCLWNWHLPRWRHRERYAHDDFAAVRHHRQEIRKYRRHYCRRGALGTERTQMRLDGCADDHEMDRHPLARRRSEQQYLHRPRRWRRCDGNDRVAWKRQR